MISPDLSKLGRGFSLAPVACVFCATCFFSEVTKTFAQVSPSPTPNEVPRTSESLKGKSDEELVRLLIGGKSARKLEAEVRRANEVETHFPDHFGEMLPKDAALALVQDNCNLKLKTQLRISVRGENRRPPDKGRVELRLEGPYLNIQREGLLNLSSDRMTSTLSFSNVELRGPVRRSRIERAIRRTTRCDLPGEEARRLYEVIWWLGQVQFARPGQEADSTEATTERIITTDSVGGKLSVEPGGPQKREFILCWGPLSECYHETFDDDLHAGFVHFILREMLKRHGVDLDETTAVLGEESYSSAEEKFVFTSKPPSPNDPGTSKWIGRMLRNLENKGAAGSTREQAVITPYRSSVISKLASLDEPLRYPDPRIDDALFLVLRGGLSPQALDRKTDERGFNDAAHAAKALAGRKQADAFPIIMQLLEVRNDHVRYAKDNLLESATLLAPVKPEYRQKLIAYLTSELQDLARSPHFASALFDSVWRGDLRELTPVLQSMATASAEEIEAERGSSWTDPPRPVVGRFHDARRILTAWREVDVLTKLKLDAIIEASSGYVGAPAELLHREFAALPDIEREQAIEFARWLGEYQMKEVHTSWDPKAIVEAFAGAN